MRGCIMEVHVLVTCQPTVVLWLVSVEVIQDNVYLGVRILGNDLVYELQKLASPSPVEMTCFHQPGHNVEGGE
jgi:hypothetical protein